jgi:hypothetical protein
MESWALLKHLHNYSPTPWLCVGDFNEIVEQSEKKWGALRREGQMEGFRKALEVGQLGDLGYSGPRFTWSNRRQDGTFTKKRLDRAVANLEWLSRFQYVVVQVLAAQASYHNPLLVEFSEYPAETLSNKRSFKFEACWTTDEEWKAVVQAEWDSYPPVGDPMQDVQNRLSLCQKALTRWSWKKFGNSHKQLKKKTKMLIKLQEKKSPAVIPEIKRLQEEIDGILEREDIRWKQRAKQNWYREGDRNT